MSAAPARALDESAKNELLVLIGSRENAKALERVRSLLAENGEDADLLLFFARLAADPGQPDIYDPRAALEAYEKLYGMAKAGGAAEVDLSKLMEEIDEAWMRAILDATIEVEDDPIKDYGRFAGNMVPVFLYFDADWCPPCRQMLVDVKSFDVRFLDKVLVIRDIYSGEADDLSKKYEVKGIPYNVFIDRRGNEMRIMGMVDRKKLFAAYYAISDFFYEEKLLEGETLEGYINRVYAAMKDFDEKTMDDIIAGKRDPMPAGGGSEPAERNN